VSVYLDASVLVALFTQDAFTVRARTFLAARLPILIVSDFAAAEFASAVARLVRTQEITNAQARAVFADFDAWRARGMDTALATPPDILAAASFIRRLDVTLRTADAVNIAIAQRLDATLATFDVKIATSAGALGGCGRGRMRRWPSR
jgi:predicted nucleic acid-binding protein